MHEIGIMFEVVKTVVGIAEKNNLTEIDTLVLQIGELSPVIPKYVRACYPVAADGTILEKTKLKIEVLPANAMCNNCGKVFNIIENRSKCPHCGGIKYKLLTGKEFNIKEILAV